MRQPFIGRADLLEKLRERYRKAQCGDGGAVILHGEAGIGKSRLIERFVESVRANDPHVVSTAAVEYVSSPFAPIVTVVDKWLQTRPELFTLHPGLREAVDLILKAEADVIAPSAGERRRCFDGVAQLFRLAAADAPTTLVVDDLHYADPATVQLLQHIVSATRRSAFLLIATTRPLVIASGVAPSPISALQRLSNVTSLAVAPLTDDQCERLIADSASGLIGREGRRRIQRRAEGNPLFAEELVRQALEIGNNDLMRVPATIFESVVERCSLLSERGREALSLAAALGRTFDVTLLARIMDAQLADLLPIVRLAVRLGLVEETAGVDTFRFRHALTQEAIYGELLPAERREVHRRIFSELRAAGENVQAIAALAFHAYASGDRETTAYYNELAGDHAAGNQAFESAVEFYERTLSAFPDAATKPARVCQKLATAYLLAGFPDRAMQPAQLALEQERLRQNAGSIADALLFLGDIAEQSGEDERRLRLLAEAYDVLDGTSDPRLQAKRSLCAFQIAIAERKVDDVPSDFEQTANSREIDLPIALALHKSSAHAFLMQRHYQAAVRAQIQAVNLAAESGSPEYLASARFGLGEIFALSGEMARASESFGEAAAIARKHWATTEGALGIAFQAETELIRGNIRRARELLEDGMNDARLSDHPILITLMGRTGIFLGLRTDDFALVRETARALDLETIFRDRTPERYHALSGAFAQFLALQGRHDEARVVLANAIQRVTTTKRLKSWDWSPCTMVTVAMMGNEEDVPPARKMLADWFAPYAQSLVGLFDAILANRFGDPAGAARRAEEAIAGFRAYEFRFEEAQALAIAGHKKEALAMFEEMGCPSQAQSLRDELTPKNRQGRPAHALTSRERDVATLVADGLTNREISDRLSVSEKTVETHLASIFAKLGVRSRADVVSQFESRVATAG